MPPTALPLATRAPALPLPTWVPRDLEMPATAEFAGNSSNAIWNTREDVDALRNYFSAQAARAGYTVYVIPRSAGAIYDLLLVKGANAWRFNLTRGLQTTVITLARVGILHLQVTGATNLQIDLPLREPIDLRAGSEVSIGTAVPNAQCARCEFFVNLHIAPFKGIGAYASKPAGVYLIDAWIIPGGDPEKDDYRYAQECTVVVTDASSGNFQCNGLVNIRDDFKHIDIRGSWQP